MGPFAKGDVVLFPFPFTDLSARKLRPCLVLSDEMGQDILLCQITSQQIPRDHYAVELKKSQTDSGTLMIDSFIRSNMLFTASIRQINRKLCKVRDGVYQEVISQVVKLVTK